MGSSPTQVIFILKKYPERAKINSLCQEGSALQKNNIFHDDALRSHQTQLEEPAMPNRQRRRHGNTCKNIEPLFEVERKKGDV